MGENSTAFGGAIRDMWNPTCLGDPGKVRDAEYHCTTDDGGGVHSNSGVPNHGYALLVDGGPSTARVTGIGLTKAAHIYCGPSTRTRRRSVTSPTTRTRSTASCADLVGSS